MLRYVGVYLVVFITMLVLDRQDCKRKVRFFVENGTLGEATRPIVAAAIRCRGLGATTLQVYT